MFDCLLDPKAMYGYSLDGSEVSLSSYVIYYTAMGEVQYDKETKKPKKATVQIILKKKMKFIMGAIALGVFSSLFYPNDYKVVETSINSVWDLYSMNHLINNFVLSGKTIYVHRVVICNFFYIHTHSNILIFHLYFFIFKLLLKALLRYMELR